MVISHKITEKLMGYRGSKSAMSKSIVVKEQRVDGNYLGLTNPRLRYTLTGLKRDFLINCYNGLYPTACVYVGMMRISNQISRTVVLYSSLTISPKINLITNNFYFLTGFTDAEGSFTLNIRSSDKYTSK
jgi:hypothetical protein